MANDLVYQPPGVYIAEDALPVPNLGTQVALPPSRVCLVGPSVGYQTFTEAVVLTGIIPVTLSQLGVDTASIVVKTLTGTTATIAVDYSVSQTGSPVEEAVTTVTRIGGGLITDGQTVYVTYNYTNSAYYVPYVSSDFDEIQSRYGTALNTTTGNVASPLSLAAKLVMEQGTREMILVPTKGSSVVLVTTTQLKAAYALLDSRDDVGMVVPLTVGITGTDISVGDTTNAATDLKTHVEASSDNGLYRIGIYGLDKAAVRSHDALATAVASKRVMLAFPNVLTWFNGYKGTTMELDGYFLAAAYAGMFGSRQAQEPLTRKGVRSFTSIPARVLTTMTVSYKNNLSDKGVSVSELTSDGRLVVRHGVTTDRTSVLTREASIIRAKDTLLRLIFLSLDRSGIIGSPLDTETPVRVRGLVDGALSQGVAAGLVVSYSNLKVRQSASSLTTLEVKFSYQPAFPLNFVTVSFSINTTTGNTSEA